MEQGVVVTALVQVLRGRLRWLCLVAAEDTDIVELEASLLLLRNICKQGGDARIKAPLIIYRHGDTGIVGLLRKCSQLRCVYGARLLDQDFLEARIN